ncbi:MAG: hypothetical protein GC201_16030 [Alphaproteobacteria bacterium]|nr:hypothetical protein [Alphaproteobacteria bacterium]
MRRLATAAATAGLTVITAVAMPADCAAQVYADPAAVEAHGKKQKAAQEAWVVLPAKVKYCMGQALAMSQLSFEMAIREKQPPQDPRFSTQMARCHRLADRELRTNFPCTLDERGQPVQTYCDEVYAEVGARQPVPLSFEQYVAADLHAKHVDIIEQETAGARSARLGGQPNR